jgi:hypothetical protein
MLVVNLRHSMVRLVSCERIARLIVDMVVVFIGSSIVCTDLLWLRLRRSEPASVGALVVDPSSIDVEYMLEVLCAASCVYVCGLVQVAGFRNHTGQTVETK